MRRLASPLSLVLTILLTGLAALPMRAADDPPAKSPPKKGGAKAVKADPAEWKKLIARRNELMKLSEQLFKEARTADAEGKKKINEQMQQLRAEFETELQPKIVKLAPAIYEKDPDDVDAAEVLISPLFRENKYKDVIAMAEKALGSGKNSPPLLTFLGIAQFATHDFEGAKATLLKAEKADKVIFPQLGARYLPACDEYIDYWKKEQEIRASEKEADDLPRVSFKTTKGEIVLELFENEAPNTVASFISLVEKGAYDGIDFHRVIPNFMAQGGDVGDGGPGYTIACECYRDDARMHFQGSLSMAHAGKDTGGSQFFLTHLPTAHLNHVDGKEESNHTVFGRIIKGLDVALALRPGDERTNTPADRIESAKVLRKRDHEYKPKTNEDKPKGTKRSKGKTSSE